MNASLSKPLNKFLNIFIGIFQPQLEDNLVNNLSDLLEQFSSDNPQIIIHVQGLELEDNKGVKNPIAYNQSYIVKTEQVLITMGKMTHLRVIFKLGHDRIDTDNYKPRELLISYYYKGKNQGCPYPVLTLIGKDDQLYTAIQFTINYML